MARMVLTGVASLYRPLPRPLDLHSLSCPMIELPTVDATCNAEMWFAESQPSITKQYRRVSLKLRDNNLITDNS